MVDKIHPIVSVSMVVRNEARYIRGALTALINQSLGDCEVVIVDNGSTDGTYEICQEFVKHGVILIAESRNLGIAALRNMSWSRCHGEYIFFTDGDCQPSLNWLERGVEFFKEDPSIGGVEGKTFYQYEGVVTISDYNTKNFFAGEYLTCNVAYRHSVLEQCGGFDESFRCGHEDRDLAIRVQKNNQISFDDQMIVCHKTKRMSAKTIFARTNRSYDQVRLLKKHGKKARGLRGVIYPEHLLTIFCPFLLITHFAYRSRRDIWIGLAKYLSLIYERVIIWRAGLELRIWIL